MSFWGWFKEFAGDALLAFFSLFLLGHFIMFWLEGYVKIGEPNLVLRAVETGMLIALAALGIERLWGDFGRLWKGKDEE